MHNKHYHLPNWLRYFSKLSQSSLVRQKIIARSILCSLIARTQYSPFSILTASDKVSANIKSHQHSFLRQKSNSFLRMKLPTSTLHFIVNNYYVIHTLRKNQRLLMTCKLNKRQLLLLIPGKMVMQMGWRKKCIKHACQKTSSKMGSAFFFSVQFSHPGLLVHHPPYILYLLHAQPSSPNTR